MLPPLFLCTALSAGNQSVAGGAGTAVARGSSVRRRVPPSACAPCLQHLLACPRRGRKGKESLAQQETTASRRGGAGSQHIGHTHPTCSPLNVQTQMTASFQESYVSLYMGLWNTRINHAFLANVTHVCVYIHTQVIYIYKIFSPMLNNQVVFFFYAVKT